ncbi:MAG TPA: SpoIIE family protein phosphatase [Candidatus Omnitrophota bacterium]|nr:SpoIIE family protein phosphatase [Candidatus Omnitrophota bacterium]HPS20078.1 SpoIIE family protein phosphatase [Candidatus Omnitrophota bacterium]
MRQKRNEHETFVDIIELQVSKTGQNVSGDVIFRERSAEATTVILCDGLGSGIKANLAANMAASRIGELLRLGLPVRRSCERVVGTMHSARTEDIPFAAFIIARIRHDGFATILSYEMPMPLFVKDGFCYVRKPHYFPLGNEVVGEIGIMMKPSDALILVTDGVSQAGMGEGEYRMGWTMEGVCTYVNGLLRGGADIKDLSPAIFKNVRAISGDTYGDDTSLVTLLCRNAETLHILTGLPENKMRDKDVIQSFASLGGKKVVCGSTTAEVVARVLDRKVELFDVPKAYYEPPAYAIDGFDLVTEGAITLNQAYNILDADWGTCDLQSPVSDLCRLMKSADRINFWVGDAVNKAHADIVFKQMNILPRLKIVERLADKLRNMEKLVTVEHVV